jgi:hypothetical protein
VVESQNYLVISILREEFGDQLVFKSIEYKQNYRDLIANEPSLLSGIFNELSYKWQEGKAKEYLDSLEESLQHCLICHLAEDYIYNESSVPA